MMSIQRGGDWSGMKGMSGWESYSDHRAKEILLLYYLHLHPINAMLRSVVMMVAVVSGVSGVSGVV